MSSRYVVYSKIVLNEPCFRTSDCITFLSEANLERFYLEHTLHIASSESSLVLYIYMTCCRLGSMIEYLCSDIAAMLLCLYLHVVIDITLVLFEGHMPRTRAQNYIPSNYSSNTLSVCLSTLLSCRDQAAM